jgi:hypothetical protein
MSSSLEHLTFGGLRRDRERDWFRMSDLVDATGGRMTRYEIRHAITRAGLPMPTVKRYGHWHYTAEHMEAVRAYAAREGLIQTTEKDHA